MPYGDLCKSHYEEILEAFPDADVQEWVLKYQACEVTKQEFHDFLHNKECSVNDPHFVPDFPRADAGTCRRTVIRMCREARVVEEAEFANMADSMKPNSIAGIPCFETPNEDGDPSMFAVFPDDGSPEVQSLRKVQIFSDIEVFHTEYSLERNRCFRKGQAADTSRSLKQAQLQQRPSTMKTGSSSNAWKLGDSWLSLTAAVNKAKELVRKRQADKDAKAAAAAGALQSDDDEDANVDLDEEVIVPTASRRVSCLDASMVLGNLNGK